MINHYRIRLDVLERAAACKPRGYLAACRAAGRVDGDYLVVAETSAREISNRYRGWGDKVRDFLKPLVRGTRLENCSGCAKRQQKLNQVGAAFHFTLNRLTR